MRRLRGEPPSVWQDVVVTALTAFWLGGGFYLRHLLWPWFLVCLTSVLATPFYGPGDVSSRFVPDLDFPWTAGFWIGLGGWAWPIVAVLLMVRVVPACRRLLGFVGR